MTAVEIIEEIKRLPKEEQSKALEFARLETERILTPDELGRLAQQMVDASDPAEADRLQREITRGFCGGDGNRIGPSALLSSPCEPGSQHSQAHFAFRVCD